jgi:phage-related tail fiber protein
MSQTKVEAGGIDSNAVTSANISDNAVGTSQIANDAVTNAKIADNAVGTSQIANDAVTLDKINFTLNSVPTGAIFHFAASTPPTGYLKANGNTVPNGTGTVQGISANFSALYAILGSTYGAAGRLPDLRGEFIRGWDNSRGIDSGRTFASWQKGTLVGGYDDNDDAGDISTLQGRTFRDYGSDTINSTIASSLYGMPRVRYLITGNSYNDYGLNQVQNWTAITRPRNVALLACIKY